MRWSSLKKEEGEMSLDGTEISSDQPIEVPESYGGILDPKVVSDENGNVTQLPAEDPIDEGFTGEQAAAYNGYYERQRAFDKYTSLLAYIPGENRPTDL